MTFRRHAGAGRGIDENTFFRVEGFEEEGVRNDTDIRAEAEEQDFIAVSHYFGERRRAESTFFYDDSFFGIGGECWADFPAFLRFNAVRDGELFPFGAGQVIGGVSVLGEDEESVRVGSCGFDADDGLGQHSLRLLGA